MARKTRSPTLVSDCLYLAHCSPEGAMEWLAQRPVTRSTVTGTIDTPADCHLPEYILFRRRDPFIDLGLARHGRSRSVLRRLYDKAGENLRVVLAGNGSLFTGDDLHSGFWMLEQPAHRSIASEILGKGTLPVLRGMVTNPDLPSQFYASMIEEWKPTTPPEKADGKEAPLAFSNERFRMVVKFLADNPRISVPREESAERFYLDGFAEYDYNRFYIAAWKLAEVAPVNAEWAEALASLYRKLHKPTNCLSNIDDVIKRWQVELGRFSMDYYREVRGRLAANFVKPSLEQLRSDDPARRDAFFSTFDPKDPEFADLDWTEFLDLDRHWGFMVYHNLKVWASPKARRKYREALWAGTSVDNDLTPIGFWDERKETLKIDHPEWFADEDDRLEDEEEQSPLARSEEVEHLRLEMRQVIASLQERNNAAVITACVFVAGMIVGLLF